MVSKNYPLGRFLPSILCSFSAWRLPSPTSCQLAMHINSVPRTKREQATKVCSGQFRLDISYAKLVCNNDDLNSNQGWCSISNQSCNLLTKLLCFQIFVILSWVAYHLEAKCIELVVLSPVAYTNRFWLCE